MTTLIMVAFLFFGLSAYNKLPVAALPSIEYPTISVSASFPGASAEKVADLVTGPLEQVLMSNITNVDVVTSSSSYQSSSITIQFNLKKNILEAVEEVSQALNEAQAQLPTLPSLPSYNTVNPSQTPILYIVLASETETLSQLYEWTFTFLGQRISLLDGVSHVSTYGFPHAVRMFVDPQSLAAKKIGMTDLSGFIQSANPDVPVGNFYGKEVSYTLISNEQLNDGNLYNDLIVKYQDGEPVKIQDIGYSKNGVSNNKQMFQFITKDDIRNCAVLAIQKQDEANTIDTANTVLQFLDTFKDQIPGSIQTIVPYDQSKWVKEAVLDVEHTLLLSLFLVVSIIFIYLGKIRNTIIPAITLPITIIGTWAIMYLLGFSLNILTFLALTLSIGFLIDDAIIMLENIVRHAQTGKTPIQAAFDGAKQICPTIISTSLSLCAVFIPILFMGGMIGLLLHEFAATIIIAVFLSGLISLTLTPMLCSRFIPKYSQKENMSWMEKKSEQMNSAIIEKYKKALSWATKYKFLMIMIALGCLVINGILYISIPKTFLPEDDLGTVEVFAQSAESTSPESMNKYITSLGNILKQDPNVDNTILISGSPSANEGMFYVNLIPEKKTSPYY